MTPASGIVSYQLTSSAFGFVPGVLLVQMTAADTIRVATRFALDRTVGDGKGASTAGRFTLPRAGLAQLGGVSSRCGAQDLEAECAAVRSRR